MYRYEVDYNYAMPYEYGRDGGCSYMYVNHIQEPKEEESEDQSQDDKYTCTHDYYMSKLDIHTCLENNNNLVVDLHESSNVSSSYECSESVSSDESESSESASSESESSKPSNKNIGLFDDSSSALLFKSKLSSTKSRSSEQLPSSSSKTSYKPSSEESNIEQVHSTDENISDDLQAGTECDLV